MFAEVRPASWRLIVGFVVAYMLNFAFVNFVLFEQPFIDSINDSTGGLVNGTLIAGLLSVVVLIIGVLFIIGRVRPQDIGLQRDKLLPGIVATLIVWALTNALLALASLLVSGDIEMARVWTQRSIVVMIGILIGQLFGNALVEELGMRGFLLAQLHVKQARGATWQRAIIALIAGAIIFALSHIPSIIVRDMGFGVLGALVFNGILFGTLYMASENVFFTIGVHASLFNTAWLLPEPEIDPIIAIFIAAFTVILIWKWLDYRRTLHVGYTEPLDHTGS